jgi:hypothetical protein
MACDIVEKRRRRLVHPLNVVERYGGRPFGSRRPEQIDHRIEQLDAVSGCARRRMEFGKQQPEFCRQCVARALPYDRAQEVDPDAIGARRLGFEAPRAENLSSGRCHAPADMGEHVALADAWLPGHEQHVRPLPGRGRLYDPIGERALAVAPDHGRDR